MNKRLLVFCATIALLAAARLAMMAHFPVFEPSEARYAAISANMARTGDFIVPRFTCDGVWQPFKGKPPLAFQLAGGCCKIMGINEFSVRLASFASIVFLLGILFWAVRKITHNTDSALLGVGICATSTALYAIGGFCMTDAPLTACIAGALLVYAASCRENRAPGYGAVFAIAALLAAGMLIKGPVAMALFALPVALDAAVNRKWKCVFSARWLAGLILFLAIAAPWFCIMEAREAGFLKYFFINENLLRFLVHDYGDKYGAGRETFRGMAAVWALVVTLPWSPIAIWRRDISFRRFPVLAIAAITFFWCLTSRVPITYLLCAAPLMALHIAIASGEKDDGKLYWRVFPYAAALAVAAVAATMLTIKIATPKKMPGPSAPKKISNHYFSYEFYNGRS